MNSQKKPVTVELDDLALVQLILLCDKKNATPSGLIGEIIRDEAKKAGLLNGEVKVA